MRGNLKTKNKDKKMQIPFITSSLSRMTKKHMPDVLEKPHRWTRKDRKNQLSYLKRTIAGNKGKMTDDLKKSHAELCQLCKHGKDKTQANLRREVAQVV